LKAFEAEQFQPMRMWLAVEQFCGTLANAFWSVATLSGPKTKPTIGNGIIRMKVLFGQVQQVQAPSGFVPVILGSQEVAVG
jgi:hypothetical protein